MVHAPFQTTPGTGDPRQLTAGAPIMEAGDFKTAPLHVQRAEVFHVMIEVDDRLVLPFIPPALHTPLPPTATLVLWDCQESDAGSFKLGLVRISTRLQARPRGLLTGAYLEGSPEAARRLRAHWGFDCQPGKLGIRAYHDRIVGAVEAGGRTILRVAGLDPDPIAPHDIRDMPTVAPIRLRRPEGEAPRLLQVDLEFHITEATRSIHPRLEHFEAGAWGGVALQQEYPVRALHYGCEMRIPPARFMIDPAGSTDQKSEAVA